MLLSTFGLVLLFLFVRVQCQGQLGFNDSFILENSPKCKVASDCKAHNSGCAIGPFKGKDISICFSCEEAKQVKNQGLTVDGCTGSTGSDGGSSSALPIVAIVICVILLIVAGIALALCLLKPSCPLYKWKLKGKNAGGQGDLEEVLAHQPDDNISSKTNEEQKPVGSDTKGAGERTAAGPRRPGPKKAGRPNRAAGSASPSPSASPAIPAPDPASGNSSKTKTNQKPKGAGTKGGRPKAKASPSSAIKPSPAQ